MFILDYFFKIHIYSFFFTSIFIECVIEPYHEPNYCRITPTKDGYNQYFDPSIMSCAPCSQNLTFQAISTDGMKCICQYGFKYKSNMGGDITCEKCPNNQVASLDGWSCVTCISISTLAGVPVCEKCDASRGLITVEREINGKMRTGGRECVSCAVDTTPNEANDRCIPCSSLLSDNKKCDCPTNRLLNGYCLNSAAEITTVISAQQLSKLNYGSVTVNSEYMSVNAQAAYIFCGDPYGNTGKCQQLANLCVLLVYQNIKTKATDGKENVCTLYTNYAGTFANNRRKRATVNNIPLLVFPDPKSILSDMSITTSFNVNNRKLDLIAAIYKADGSFLGFNNVDGGLLQLCSNSFKFLDAAFYVGTDYSQKCKIDIDDLLKHETLFYELFVEYNDGYTYLYPIPILIVNFPGNENEKDYSSWTLVKRFFLVDNIGGKDISSGISNTLKALRYAKDIQLVVTLLNFPGSGKIFSPYLRINYEVISGTTLGSNSTVDVSFAVKYTMDYGNIENIFFIILGILCFVALFLSIIETWSWSKRRIPPLAFLTLLFKFFVFMCGNIANAIFVSLFIYTNFLLVNMKRQFDIQLVVNSETFNLFVLFLIVSAILKAIDIIHLIICQITIDIFFIDFEKSKQIKSTSELHQSVEISASMWRVYFIANEWNEIQTVRRINPIFQYFIAVLFLMAIGFGNLGTMDIESNLHFDEANIYYAPTCNIFRFALISLVFIISALFQYVFNAFIYERFIENKLTQFIDLCSLANVSILIFDQELHGYYIHGRSVHGKADIGLREMYENFAKEERDLVGKRGLLPEEDEQTFELLICPKFRSNYNKIIKPILEKQVTNKGQVPILSDSSRGNINVDPDTLMSIEAFKLMNLFLQNFIDHTITDLEYSMARKSFLEVLIDTEFVNDEAAKANKSMFYYDKGQSFERVIFYGNELKLTIFEILLFSLIDIILQNYFLDAFITFIVMENIVNAIRDSLGRNNLAKKTLVDKRFLI